MRHEVEKIIYEYCLLRYVPDLQRGEFINIGLMMVCKRHKWLRTGIEIDEKKIFAISPECDILRLKKQSEVFLRDDVPSFDLPVEEKYRWLAAVKSAIIQTSPSHPGIIICNTNSDTERIADILDEKFQSLFKRMVK